ncbi:MAG TPA: kinase [Blastocatellia bacterium]|nr:kinase [Blastocatellia bacterium]
MIISRTPFRISFFGGGTDYPAWYLQESGAVLSTTIDKYCYISCRYLPPFFNIRHRIVWSHIETVMTIPEILHPAVREGLRLLGFDDSVGLEIHYQGDLPARAGMGSSSAFAVGLIKALTALRGQMTTKHDLALKAIDLEQRELREHVGSQDQIAAAYGGFNVIHFLKGGEIRVEPVTISASRLAELQSRLLLFYAGSTRLASAVAAEVVSNLGRKREHLRKMRLMVDQAVTVLNNGADLDEFGRMLDETWKLKRDLSPAVSSPAVEDIYQAAISHGALGGKLLGAGGTGFLVFYVPREKQQHVKRALSACLHVPFKFESEGSMVIYYAPNDAAAFVE